VPRAFGVRSTITAQPGLHNLYSTGSSGTANLAEGFTTGFTAAFTDRFTTRLLVRFTVRVLRPALRVVLVARIVALSPASSKIASRELRLSSTTLGAFAVDHALSGSNFVLAAWLFARRKQATENCYYLRRCEIMRSVRLLWRVFLPSVGKAQGVTG
jgi:hypothetical protein